MCEGVGWGGGQVRLRRVLLLVGVWVLVSEVLLLLLLGVLLLVVCSLLLLLLWWHVWYAV